MENKISTCISGMKLMQFMRAQFLKKKFDIDLLMRGKNEPKVCFAKSHDGSEVSLGPNGCHNT